MPLPARPFAIYDLRQPGATLVLPGAKISGSGDPKSPAVARSDGKRGRFERSSVVSSLGHFPRYYWRPIAAHRVPEPSRRRGRKRKAFSESLANCFWKHQGWGPRGQRCEPFEQRWNRSHHHAGDAERLRIFDEQSRPAPHDARRKRGFGDDHVRTPRSRNFQRQRHVYYQHKPEQRQ